MSQVNHNTIPVIADPALQSFEGVGKSVFTETSNINLELILHTESCIDCIG